MKITFALCILIVTSRLDATSGITCMDDAGKQVDWFIIYKAPHIKTIPQLKDGTGYYYMDSNSPQWTLSNNKLDSTDNAVAHTLQPVYANSKDLLHVMYNDEHPDGYKTNTMGHTKGVLASDKAAGFWLIHSVPKYPPPANSSYQYPTTGERFGQTMLCISLAYKYMDVVGQLYLYNDPSFYDVSLPGDFASQNPNLLNATYKKHVTSKPFFIVTSLTSLRGETFTAFAKYTKYCQDLYEDLVAPALKVSLFVETWQSGGGTDLNSSCSLPYKVYNVKEVQLHDAVFTETRDHAKWAVSTENSLPVTCVGDINRQVSQEHRGGGTVCLTVAGVHNAFLKAVKNYEKCT